MDDERNHTSNGTSACPAFCVYIGCVWSIFKMYTYFGLFRYTYLLFSNLFDRAHSGFGWFLLLNYINFPAMAKTYHDVESERLKTENRVFRQ